MALQNPIIIENHSYCSAYAKVARYKKNVHIQIDRDTALFDKTYIYRQQMSAEGIYRLLHGRGGQSGI